jgi:hypothetical protein
MEHFGAEAGDIETRSGHRHHLDCAASQAERHGPDGVLARPVDRVAERGGDDSFGEQALFKTSVVDAREQLSRAAGERRLIHKLHFLTGEPQKHARSKPGIAA